MFSNHNRIKSQTSNRKTCEKTPKYFKTNKFLNNPWLKEKMKREIRKNFELYENKNNVSTFVGCH